MPTDRVLTLPLTSDEIIQIILQRIEKRLRSDCFLHPASTYNGFTLSFEGKIKFNDMMLGRETMVWDNHVEPKQELSPEDQEIVGAQDIPEADKSVSIAESYSSGDSPNRARVDHDLPLPIETTEGKRKVIRHKKLAEGVTA